MKCEKCEIREEFDRLSLMRFKNTSISHGEKVYMDISIHLITTICDTSLGTRWLPLLCGECLVQEMEKFLQSFKKQVNEGKLN